MLIIYVNDAHINNCFYISVTYKKDNAFNWTISVLYKYIYNFLYVLLCKSGVVDKSQIEVFNAPNKGIMLNIFYSKMLNVKALQAQYEGIIFCIILYNSFKTKRCNKLSNFLIF